MPIYVYECETCGIHFERTQRVNDPPLKRCPECDGRVHKIFQPVGIIFKGSGFYSTDHRSTSDKGEAGKSSSAADSEEE